jgi:hypothetical protein
VSEDNAEIKKQQPIEHKDTKTEVEEEAESI